MDWMWEVSGSGLFLGHVVAWLLEVKRDQAELVSVTLKDLCAY